MYLQGYQEQMFSIQEQCTWIFLYAVVAQKALTVYRTIDLKSIWLVVYWQDDFGSVSETPSLTFGGTLVGRAINDTPANNF